MLKVDLVYLCCGPKMKTRTFVAFKRGKCQGPTILGD